MQSEILPRVRLQPRREVRRGVGGALVLLVLSAATPLRSCTLWGIAGDEADGGTLISKNRDWKPDHTQVLKLRRNSTGYAYFGLYAEGNAEPGIKSGVNEKGLTVVTASASSVPKATRDHQPGKHGVLATLLARYASCDEIVAKQEAIFGTARTGFFLISDRRKILMVEVGMDGKFALRTVAQGRVVHTNHFLEKSLEEFNVKIGPSSATRLGRITELVAAATPPLTLAAIATMSKDRHDGPDNSLWRTGKSSRTMSSWIVATPAQGAPRLRVVLANPGQPEEVRVYLLDANFWRTAK